MTHPEEPLAESAPVAWHAAPRLCPTDDGTGKTCSWYHRVWQYLRLLDIISSTRTNSEFLTETFSRYARDGRHPRLLVSCTADYSMLAHVKCGYEGAPAPLAVTVIDRCPTSIMLNRWYADRYRIPLATATTDVLDYETEEPFDVVCAHSLLGRFDDEGRKLLVRRWHSLLRPGGIAVTTQRIRPDDHAGTGYTEQGASRLRERVIAAARAFPQQLGVDPEDLGAAAYEYAIRSGAHPIASPHAIIHLFAAEGFDVEFADEGAGVEERHRDRPSSTAGIDTYRMRLVARKR